MKYDLFISHASDDKVDLVLPLVDYLQRFDIKIWYDTHEIKLGDNLRRKIDEGLSQSRYAVVILSPNFLKKEWPQKELDALVSREDGKENIILTILHNITYEDIKKYSPLLSSKLMVSTKQGIDFVAREILNVVSTKEFDYKKRVVIGISGSSCSGKSWLAKKIKESRPNSVCLFDLDNYYKNPDFVSNIEYRHDNPDAVDFNKALEDFVLLINGHEVKIPQYDFETHEVNGYKVCTPAPITIIEGLFVFSNPSLLEKMNLKIWVEAYDSLRYERRISRDTKERGRDLYEVMNRYAKEVQPGYEKYIMPNIKYADIIYPNNARCNDIFPPLIEMIFAYADIKGINKI